MSVCSSGNLDLNSFDLKNRVRFRCLSAIRPALGSESLANVTAMRFGKEKRLLQYKLQQPNDSAVNLVDGGAGDAGARYRSSPLIGSRCGAILIAPGNLQRHGIITTNFQFLD